MTINTESIHSKLLSNSLLSALSDSELELIISNSKVCEYSEGDKVVREGDPGDGVYFVLSGELTVTKNFAGVCKTLNLLKSGQGFGEISLVSDAPRTATVTSSCESVCLNLEKEAFDQLMAENGKFGQKMMKLLTQRMINSESTAGQQLIDSYEALVFSLSDLADSRDPETGAHLSRVQRYCRCLASLMSETELFGDRISPQFISDIYVTSPLHDIGKVGIPDAILLKPGRLNEEEFDIMRSHTTIGARTLERVLSKLESTTFRTAYNVILHHHERYDGSGYPGGLAGEEISLEGRIMALADVYDALLSKRVYKDAFDHQKTLDIIIEGRGQHFDADITDLFLANIDQFEAIYQQFKNEPS